jgi:hypothetical protein
MPVIRVTYPAKAIIGEVLIDPSKFRAQSILNFHSSECAPLAKGGEKINEEKSNVAKAKP